MFQTSRSRTDLTEEIGVISGPTGVTHNTGIKAEEDGAIKGIMNYISSGKFSTLWDILHLARKFNETPKRTSKARFYNLRILISVTRCDPSDPFIENLLKTLVPLEDQKDPEKMAQARRALEFGQAFPKKGKNLSQDFLRRTSSTDPDSCKCQIKFSMSSIELGA